MSTFGGVLSFGQVCQQNRKSKESWKQQNNNLGKKNWNFDRLLLIHF